MICLTPDVTNKQTDNRNKRKSHIVAVSFCFLTDKSMKKKKLNNGLWLFLSCGKTTSNVPEVCQQGATSSRC